MYSYCANNPLIYWDPTGHAPGDVYISVLTGKTYVEGEDEISDSWSKAANSGKTGSGTGNLSGYALSTSSGMFFVVEEETDKGRVIVGVVPLDELDRLEEQINTNDDLLVAGLISIGIDPYEIINFDGVQINYIQLLTEYMPYFAAVTKGLGDTPNDAVRALANIFRGLGMAAPTHGVFDSWSMRGAVDAIMGSFYDRSKTDENFYANLCEYIIAAGMADEEGLASMRQVLGSNANYYSSSLKQGQRNYEEAQRRAAAQAAELEHLLSSRGGLYERGPSTTAVALPMEWGLAGLLGLLTGNALLDESMSGDMDMSLPGMSLQGDIHTYSYELVARKVLDLFAEHKKKGTTNRANEEKHEKGQSRQKLDQRGEKGDARRRDYSNKRR